MKPSLLLGFNGWEFFADEELPLWAYVVDQAARRTYVSDETYEALCCDDEAWVDFVEALGREGTGMQYIVRDAGPYARAAQAAEAQGVVSAQPSRVADLLQRAEVLLVQSSGLRGEQMTAMKWETFAAQFADLRAEVERTETDLAEVRGYLGLVADVMRELAE